MRYYSVLGSDPIFFIFWALLALTSLGTLPGSVWLFCHMLVNNIHGFIWIWSTCLCKVVPSVTTSCLWECSWGQAVPVQEGENHCWSEQGDFSPGCWPSTGKSSELRNISFPVGLYSCSHHFSQIVKYMEGLINLGTLLFQWKKVSVFRISPSLVLFAKNHLYLTENLYLK